MIFLFIKSKVILASLKRKVVTRMVGLFVGFFSGGFQYWLLSKFTQHVTSGHFKATAVLLGFAQLLLPLLTLLCVAFFRRQELLLTATGITVTLILCAVSKSVAGLRRVRRGDDRNA